MTKTTILVEKETRQLLQKVGRKEQTYDMLIRELVVKPDICKRCGEVIKENSSGSGFGPSTRQVFRESTGAHD
jgi:predicted Zn-ribbon and HTH transcriptional regulator